MIYIEGWSPYARKAEKIDEAPHICEICGCVDTREFNGYGFWGRVSGEVKMTENAYLKVANAVEKHVQHGYKQNSFWNEIETNYCENKLSFSTRHGCNDAHILDIICAFKDVASEDPIFYRGCNTLGEFILRKGAWKKGEFKTHRQIFGRPRRC